MIIFTISFDAVEIIMAATAVEIDIDPGKSSITERTIASTLVIPAWCCRFNS